MGHYDNIVINLEDEVGLRFTLFLLTQFTREDPILEKIITVLHDPVIERLLNRNTRLRNTILSAKLAAKYITQLSFQKNLEKVCDELCAPEGFEFNHLELGVHVPHALLTSKSELKDRLLARGLIYIGTVDVQKNVTFEAYVIYYVQQLVVISRGYGGPKR